MSFLEKLTRPFKQLPHSLYWVVFAAVVVRLILFIYLVGVPTTQPFLQSDSYGYLQIGQNIITGHGFSAATSSPYFADTERVPVYPYLLAGSSWFFHSYLPVLILQILLSAAIVIMTYLIARKLSSNRSVPFFAALGMAFEPFSIFISLNLLTEVPFLFVLSLGILAALYDIKRENLYALGAASALFGLTALIRPIGEFLPLVLILFCLAYFPKRQFWRRIATIIIPFLIVISPWLLRNYEVFGVPTLSSGGFQNIYSDLGASVISQRDNVSWNEIKENLNQQFMQSHGAGEGGVQQDPRFGGALFTEGLKLILQNPIPAAIALIRLSFTFFTHDVWIYSLQKWQFVHSYGTTFSPSFVLTTQGPIVAIKETIKLAGASLIIPILGRTFWIFLDIFCITGCVFLYRQGGVKRRTMFFLVALIIYFWVLSLSAGSGLNGRYRYPIDPIIIAIASLGGVGLYTKRQVRRERIRQAKAVL